MRFFPLWRHGFRSGFPCRRPVRGPGPACQGRPESWPRPAFYAWCGRSPVRRTCRRRESPQKRGKSRPPRGPGHHGLLRSSGAFLMNACVWSECRNTRRRFINTSRLAIWLIARLYSGQHTVAVPLRICTGIPHLFPARLRASLRSVALPIRAHGMDEIPKPPP